jgi:hypothetical protein
VRRNRIKRFIVTGCPRSGTAYAAAHFSALGVRRNRWEKVTWARIAPITADLAAHYGYKAPVADRAA